MISTPPADADADVATTRKVSLSALSGKVRPLFYSAPQSLEGRSDGYIKASLDDGATWWLRGDRLDSATDPGFGYSGLVDLGAAAAVVVEADLEADQTHAAHQRQLGVIYEPWQEGGVVFTMVTVDYSDLV